MSAATFSLPLTPPPPSFDGHLPRFAEGRHRLVGAVVEPERPFPGAPAAGDGPPRPGHPGPPKPTPFPPPPQS